MEDIVIEFKGVYKSFGDNQVLRGLDLAIRRGEVITIMGRSGTGKSVLLKLLIGLMKPDEGQILVEGQDIVPLSEKSLNKIRSKFGFLFQGAALFDSLTVGENVAYPLRVGPAVCDSDEEMERIVTEKLSMVGLKGIEGLLPEALSGGMKKRVALARAIARGPNYILYDEPTTGLDPTNVNKIIDLMLKLQGEVPGLTSVVVTHDLDSAFKVSDRLAFLAGGKIVAIGGKEEILNSPVAIVRSFLAGHEF